MVCVVTGAVVCAVSGAAVVLHTVKNTAHGPRQRLSALHHSVGNTNHERFQYYEACS